MSFEFALSKSVQYERLPGTLVSMFAGSKPFMGPGAFHAAMNLYGTTAFVDEKSVNTVQGLSNVPLSEIFFDNAQPQGADSTAFDLLTNVQETYGVWGIRVLWNFERNEAYFIDPRIDLDTLTRSPHKVSNMEYRVLAATGHVPSHIEIVNYFEKLNDAILFMSQIRGGITTHEKIRPASLVAIKDPEILSRLGGYFVGRYEPAIEARYYDDFVKNQIGIQDPPVVAVEPVQDETVERGREETNSPGSILLDLDQEPDLPQQSEQP